VEYFVWFRRGEPPLDDADLNQAMAEGPQLPGAQRTVGSVTGPCRVP
jgi:hypothetical protein